MNGCLLGQLYLDLFLGRDCILIANCHGASLASIFKRHFDFTVDFTSGGEVKVKLASVAAFTLAASTFLERDLEGHQEEEKAHHGDRMTDHVGDAFPGIDYPESADGYGEADRHRAHLDCLLLSVAHCALLASSAQCQG